MLKRISLALALALVVAPMTVAGQYWVNKTDQLGAGASGSPKVRVEYAIDSGMLSLAYSRPSLKGRALNDVVPQNVPWKASDDDPATLTTNKTLIFGNVTVPPGTYTLWVLPQGEAWTLIVSKLPPATKAYQAGQDVGRMAMKTDKVQKPVDQYMMQIEPSSDRVSQDVEIRFDFGNLSAVAPFVVRR